MHSTSTGKVTPFACDMSTLTPVERQRHIATIKAVFGAVQEIRELDDGYAFRLASEEGVLMQVAAFVAKERLCCPFFRFHIEVEAHGGPLWLSLRGGERVSSPSSK